LWGKVNNCVNAINKANSNINQLNRDFQSIENFRNKLGFDLFPFKIYILPDIYRGGNLNNTSWQTVRVRGGFVLIDNVSTSSYVNGTDMFQNYAYANTYPSASYGLTASYDITLSTSQSLNPTWFWIEKNQTISGSSPSSSYWLRYGNNPTSSSLGNPTPWVSFPTANSNYIPIGTVDCYTSQSQNQALIRQFLTTDVLLSGGGAINYYFYNESASYNKDDFIFVSYNAQFTTSFITPSGSNTAAMTPGCFIAAQNVPAAPSSGSNSSGSRTPFNYYYPIWPIWPITSSIHTTVGADGGIYSGSKCNQIYWNPIAPEILLQICVNGNNVNAGVMGEMSGSVFDLSMLPYSGSGI